MKPLVIFVVALLVSCGPEREPARRFTTPSGSGKAYDAACAFWYQGFMCISEAAVIGQVRSVSDHDGDIGVPVVWHDYVLDVSGVAGDCEELTGISEFRSQTLEDIAVGSWVVVFVHYYEKKPDVCTSGMKPIVVTGPRDPLVVALLRTGLQWQRFTDQDLGLLRPVRPVDYEEIVMRREFAGAEK